MQLACNKIKNKIACRTVASQHSLKFFKSLAFIQIIVVTN